MADKPFKFNKFLTEVIDIYGNALPKSPFKGIPDYTFRNNVLRVNKALLDEYSHKLLIDTLNQLDDKTIDLTPKKVTLPTDVDKEVKDIAKRLSDGGKDIVHQIDDPIPDAWNPTAPDYTPVEVVEPLKEPEKKKGGWW